MGRIKRGRSGALYSVVREMCWIFVELCRYRQDFGNAYAALDPLEERCCNANAT